MLITEKQLREMIRESLGLPQDDRLLARIQLRIDKLTKDENPRLLRMNWKGIEPEIEMMRDVDGNPEMIPAIDAHIKALLKPGGLY